jgi:hypothetical protein
MEVMDMRPGLVHPSLGVGGERAGAFTTLWIGIAASLGTTGLVWLLGGALEQIPHLADQGASWYFWKLISPTFWSRATAWGFYSLHQVAFWAVIWIGQQQRPAYGNGLHRVNVAALAVNVFFVGMHFLQSHLWYDGLAQDVSIWSSQASVVVLLVWVILIENDRRGVFFGVRVPFPTRLKQAAVRYHGYFFAWATVYTFWYHPMERTPGHLVGFLYMFLLLLQGSLFFTRAHRNRWWKLTLEVSVLVHGTLVAIVQGNGIWPMFAFGFGAMFVVTQMHGLGWSRRVRIGVATVYVGAAAVVYGLTDIGRVWQIINIPLIDYAVLFVLAGLLGLGVGLLPRLSRLLTRRQPNLGG